MIKLSEIKNGDIVNARFEEVTNTGEVIQVDREEKKALVAHGDQEFWYDIDDLGPVPLTIPLLEQLGFVRSSDPALNHDAVAYVRGPFIVRYPEKEKNNMLLTYRDEHREINNDIYVHQFQNHYLGMTNVPLGLY